MSRIFQNVRNLRPSKSVFDLSYEKKFDCDMGQLIPVMCDEVVPGDYWKIGNQAVIRFQPLVAPVLHEMNMTTHYFFVPFRLLWNANTRELLSETGDWEDYITGGIDGNNSDTLPTWNPSASGDDKGTLWDYLGFPVNVDPAGAYPVDFPRRAYNLVYNEYYRDETLQTEVSLTNELILRRNWPKDYFTSGLPNQQRGIAPALPISGTTSAVWSDTTILASSATSAILPSVEDANATTAKLYTGAGKTNARVNLRNALNTNTVDLSVASTFDIADLRLAFQIQKWMERNARAGVRYTEFLKAHFGESPRDDRLQRPEYIGGSKTPIIISEVLQTSSTDATSPQGNLAGHGIAVSDSFCGSYRAKEFGLIIGIMSVMPRAVYQQGINRQWLKTTRYDYYFPEFANLSEQAIINAEIFVTDGNSATNQTIFAYQGRYDELRTKQNMVCNNFRDTYDYWHLSRQFSSVPSLNSTFITCDPRKDIFAAPSETGLFVSFGNIIKAVRPLPFQAEPGLIDHN